MRRELAAVTTAARTPHGYTLAVWGSGTLEISHHHPSPLDVILFVVGGTAAFGLMRGLAVAVAGAAKPASYGALGSTHLLTLVAVVLAAWGVVALVPAPWCWPLSSAVATSVFLLGHALQDAVLDPLLVKASGGA